jgi:hypothetical protein
VPIDPVLGTVGTSVAVGASCPAGAPTATALGSGLFAAACSGCGCAAGTVAVKCSATLYSFASSLECADASAPGQLGGTVDSTQSCPTPAWPGSVNGFVRGVRADPFQATVSGVCAPTGTPSKGAPVWNNSAKFCGLPRVGAGCGPRAACIPRAVAAASPCVLMEGAQACQAGLHPSSWFTSFTDGRVCASCACGAPTGADCNSSLIAVGNDYSCAQGALNGYLRSNERLCFSSTSGGYSPGVEFSGSAVQPTCRATSPMTGELVPVGPQTLCCL